MIFDNQGYGELWNTGELWYVLNHNVLKYH